MISIKESKISVRIKINNKFIALTMMMLYFKNNKKVTKTLLKKEKGKVQ